ncbi:hypothetical protein PT974_04362 [Cladobotryum mycophilum]|uniref:Apple domain-containing protein n=1 Tax=Cladobotryum mycophilum TaxID=491253 RepID=A0ABR0SUZ2_9HYPO
MFFDKILFALLAAATATALPYNGGDKDVKAPLTDPRLCVDGAPTKNGDYTINYQNLNLPSADQANAYILDPTWVVQHEMGDSSCQHFSTGASMFPWAENKCQYTCNAMEGCVSFVGYQTQNATPDNGEIFCHFFKALIELNSITSPVPNSPYKITHAYNTLCDAKTI